MISELCNAASTLPVKIWLMGGNHPLCWTSVDIGARLLDPRWCLSTGIVDNEDQPIEHWLVKVLDVRWWAERRVEITERLVGLDHNRARRRDFTDSLTRAHFHNNFCTNNKPQTTVDPESLPDEPQQSFGREASLQYWFLHSLWKERDETRKFRQWTTKWGYKFGKREIVTSSATSSSSTG